MYSSSERKGAYRALDETRLGCWNAGPSARDPKHKRVSFDKMAGRTKALLLLLLALNSCKKAYQLHDDKAVLLQKDLPLGKNGCAAIK